MGEISCLDAAPYSNISSFNCHFLQAAEPTITLSTTNLSEFTYIEGNGPSNIKSFTVNANGLIDNVIITAPINFEISLSGGTSFIGNSQVTIPILSGEVNNVFVYVRMKAGLAEGNIGPESLIVSTTGFADQTINLSGIVTVRPVIMLSPTALTGFTYVYTAGPSVSQSFTVSGNNLQNNVTLTAPIHYEISIASNSGYSSSITLYPSDGTLATTTIYVRLRAGFGVTAYNEDIIATSQYAETKTVLLSGSVTAAATLIVTPSMLNGFIYTRGSGPSVSQFFVLTGSNLNSDVIIEAPDNFEISITQNGTYSGSLTLTPSEGTINQIIYVRMKSGLSAGSYGPSSINLNATGAVTKTVALSGQVVNSATLIVTPIILGGFSYVSGNGPSSAQSFIVSGASLTKNIIITPPTNYYEISFSPDSGFQSTSLSLVPTNGTVAPTTIYVRLKAGYVAGNYDESILITSSGAISQTVVTLNGQVYNQPTIIAGGGGNYCVASTIELTSSGENIQSQYWNGPNNFYSTAQNPSIDNSTPAMSGTYTVIGNVVVGGNLISNGDFEIGNVGFGSSYGYPSEPFSTSSLQPEGLYAIVNLPSEVHNNFTSTGVDHTTGTGRQMVVNGATNPGMVVWSQSVAVLPNANYEFSCWVQTVVKPYDSNPAQLQLYIDGIAAGPIFTADPDIDKWTQFVYNTNSGSNTTLNIEIVNQNTIAGGNDFALDDIVMHQITMVFDSTNVIVSDYKSVDVNLSYSPSIVYSNTPVTFTTTPTNGGSDPIYEWTVNGIVVGTNSPTYTYIPQNDDVVVCKLTSSYPCAIGNPATDSVTMSVLNQYNYWLGKESTDWGTASNWTGGYVPLAGSNVEYATVTNYGTDAINDLQLDRDRTIGSLINATNKKLIIPAGKSLTVNNTITISDAENPNLILIKSGGFSTEQGTLIFHNNEAHPVYATVEMYSKAWINPDGATNQKYFWQYFGLPFQSLQANPSFYGAYVRRWDETGTTIQNHWIQLGNNDVIQSFLGYEICQPSPTTYTLKGILENKDFDSGELAYTTTALYPGQHIFGNSYTAAIDITKINFGSNMEETVYLYNTGSYNNWETNSGGTSHSSSNTNPGTYAAIPKNQAGQGGIEGQIPSMQGFLIKAMSAASGNTISIPYSSVAIKNTTLQRAKATDKNISNKKQYLRIDLKTDSVVVDRMWIFNEPNCTRSFDNGWDGPKMLAGEGVPALFSQEEDDIYQVNSVEDINDTNIGFQGEKNNKVYSLEIHSENLQQRYASLYLYDRIVEKITEIASDSTVYTFTNNNGTGIQQRFKIIVGFGLVNLNGAKEENDEGLLCLFSLDKKIGVANKSKEKGQVMIFDLLGRIVDNFSIQPQTIQMSPHDLATGVYVINIFTQNKKIIKKIIIR